MLRRIPIIGVCFAVRLAFDSKVLILQQVRWISQLENGLQDRY